MKKLTVKTVAMVMALVMVGSAMTACSEKKDDTKKQATDVKKDDSKKDQKNQVKLNDVYTVTDPEDVEYDKRVVLYKPLIEGTDEYSAGQREAFCVVYSKEDKGQFMYEVTSFDTKENAEAYQKQVKNSTIDGTVVISTSDAKFFASMESFIPNATTWTDNLKASGMMELK